MKYLLRGFFTFIAGLVLICGSLPIASADQTININLANFQDDGLRGSEALPNYTVYGVQDGDVITVNFTNSTQGFLGYINDGAGSAIQITSGGGLNESAPTGQFYGIGDVLSLAWDNAIVGSYTARITVGTGALLSQAVNAERGIADATPETLNAIGYFFLEWRNGMVNQANWKGLSILASGTPLNQGITANYLSAKVLPKLELNGDIAKCSAGEYRMSRGSEVQIDSIVYTLLIDDKVYSRVYKDDDGLMLAELKPSSNQIIAGSISGDSASWNLSGMKNFNVKCEVSAFKDGSSITTNSELVYDSGYLAAISAKELEDELARTQSTAANFTKDMREMRKRIAARQP
jgi:hypothetical protein